MKNLLDYVLSQDRILTFPWMGYLCVRLTNYKIYEIYESPQKQLETAIIMDSYFDADFIYPLDDGIVLEEAIGVEFEKPDYEFPSGGSPIVFGTESLHRLSVPDPYVNRRMSTNLESYRLLSEYFDKPLAVSVPGPVTLACSLMGLETFLRATVKRQGVVKELLEYTTDVVRRYSVAIVNSGVELLCISEPSAILLSPKMYENLCSPNVKSVFEYVDCFKVFHPCGNTTRYVNALLKTGAQGFSLDQAVNMQTMAAEFPADVVLIGNLDPVEVLWRMDVEGVKSETEKLLNDMKGYKNFLFSFGCDCVPYTPFENLKVAIQTAKNYKMI